MPVSALMTIHRCRFFRSRSTLLMAGGLLGAALLSPAVAGPLVRRVEQRKACQEFATKLQQSGGNPAAAQQVYQQGVLQLVSRFGENPCSDIPAPSANGMAAPSVTPVAPPATTTPSQAESPAAPAPSVQQQQACQQFASKLQEASASGGAAAAQQTYKMGMEKLTGMFGSNPCPSVRPPQ
jgi:hypothetical protein